MPYYLLTLEIDDCNNGATTVTHTLQRFDNLDLLALAFCHATNYYPANATIVIYDATARVIVPRNVTEIVRFGYEARARRDKKEEQKLDHEDMTPRTTIKQKQAEV